MSKPDPEETAVIERFMERAVVARAGIALLSVYLVAVSFAWSGRDEALLGIDWLAARPVFLAAGLLGLPMLGWPRWKIGLVPWLLVLGLACAGRTFTVVFGEEFTFGERLRAVGWLVMWVFALAAVMQIQAAEILRRRGHQWSG